MTTPPTYQITRGFAYVVAGIQLGAGCTGLAFGRSHFTSIAYRPALQVLSFLPGAPSAWWSALLILFALAAIVALQIGSAKQIRQAYSRLSAYWLFWTILFAAAWTQPGSGPWAPWLTLMCVVGNARPVVARTIESPRP